jgi:hypothetical protein
VEFEPSRRKYGESRAESKALNSVAARNQHVGLIHTSRHDEESSVVDRPGFEFPGANPPGFTRVQGVCAAGLGPRGWASFRLDYRPRRLFLMALNLFMPPTWYAGIKWPRRRDYVFILCFYPVFISSHEFKQQASEVVKY